MRVSPNQCNTRLEKKQRELEEAFERRKKQYTNSEGGRRDE